MACDEEDFDLCEGHTKEFFNLVFGFGVHSTPGLFQVGFNSKSADCLGASRAVYLKHLSL
jgi:hypothetical protein